MKENIERKISVDLISDPKGHDLMHLFQKQLPIQTSGFTLVLEIT